MNLILLLVLSSDLGAPSAMPDQDVALRVGRYFTEAASAGDHETIAFLVSNEGLAGRKGESPRSLVNRYVARLTRAFCVLDESTKANEYKQAGRDVAGIRLNCANGKHEDIQLVKVGGQWKLALP